MTAVHTLGRLPQAADRAILPIRIRPRIGREPGILVLGNRHRKRMPRLNFPEESDKKPFRNYSGPVESVSTKLI